MGSVEAVRTVSRLAAPAAVLGMATMVLVAGLTACTSTRSPSAPPVPAGFVEYRTDAFAFAYPAGWKVSADTDLSGHPVQSFDGPVIPPGVFQGQARVGRIDHYEEPLQDQLSQYRVLVLTQGRRVTADRPITIPGALAAHRLDAVYTTVTADGTSVQLEVTDLYLITRNKVLLDFLVRAPAGGAAKARIPEVLNSFHLTGEHHG